MARLTDCFSGSYHPDDVAFLLRRMDLAPVPLDERERLIQSGGRHYSEMIGPEDAPSRQRLALFRECFTANGSRFARDLVNLAAALAQSAVRGRLTLVSIARAGTPAGVLLLRRLRRWYPEIKAVHYSISVIRDRGVDAAAVRAILTAHPPETLRFIDGWTGKGTIAGELQRSIRADASLPASLDPGLWVPLDVCGAARHAASADDYLIPPTVLGGTVSGLVSRSVLERDAPSGAWHGCVVLGHLRRLDLSRWFVRAMEPLMDALPLPVSVSNATEGPERFRGTMEFLRASLHELGMTDINRIKTGIGEAVRVLLRRLPKTVWLRRGDTPDASLIRRLAALRKVPVAIRPEMPFAAAAIIGDAPPVSP